MAAEAQRSEPQASRGGKRSRLMIDISPELRRRIKVAAAQRDLSVREYVERLLEAAVPAEARAPEQLRRPMTRERFEQLRQVREAISGGRVFSDSTELIRQMREERSEYLAQL